MQLTFTPRCACMAVQHHAGALRRIMAKPASTCMSAPLSLSKVSTSSLLRCSGWVRPALAWTPGMRAAVSMLRMQCRRSTLSNSAGSRHGSTSSATPVPDAATVGSSVAGSMADTGSRFNNTAASTSQPPYPSEISKDLHPDRSGKVSSVSQEEIERRIQANRTRRAARQPYTCPACRLPIYAPPNIPKHFEVCCPDLYDARAWDEALSMTLPPAPVDPAADPTHNSRRRRPPPPQWDELRLRALMDVSVKREEEARARCLDVAFRTGEVDSEGAPVKHGPEEIARRMGLSVDRAGRLLNAALRAVPLLPDSTPLDIVYERGGLLAVNKPPGIQTAPAHRYKGTSMVNRAMAYLNPGGTQGPHVLHRLDMDTSGLLLLATKKESVVPLHMQFRRRQVRKLYLALCVGVPGQDLWMVDQPIGFHPGEQCARLVGGEGAKPALTSFAIVASNPDVDLASVGAAHGVVFDSKRTKSLRGVSLLACAPRTGRTHQIRVHAAHTGNPLLGDELYGVQGPWITRQALHAAALEVEHPQEKVRVPMWAPLPSDFIAAMAQLGLQVPGGGTDVVEEVLAPIWDQLGQVADEWVCKRSVMESCTDTEDDDGGNE